MTSRTHGLEGGKTPRGVYLSLQRSIVILITAFILAGLLSCTSVSFAQEIPKGGKWVKKAEMPTIRSDLAAVAVGGKIYAIGGRNNVDGRLSVVEEYNPASDTWKKVADMPTAREGHAAGAVNGKIYAIGGFTTVKRRNGTKVLKKVKIVEEYDPATNTWAQKGEESRVNINPATSFNVSLTVLDGKIYVTKSQLDIYDPATDTWSEGPKLIDSGFGATAGVVNGKVYAVGGWRHENHVIEVVAEYDPAQNTWVKKQDWQEPRYLCGPSGVTLGGQLYVIGGSTGQADGWRMSKTVESYDPATERWTKLKDMPTARQALATAAVRGKIYAIGGIVKEAADFRNGQTMEVLAEEVQTGIVEEYTAEGWPFAVSPQGKLATTWGALKARS